jgi:excisionase family DNA binding protein
VTEKRAIRYLSALEAARYMGVSRRTFFMYVRKDVPSIQIGARVLFDAADLDTWAEAHKRAPEPKEPTRIEAPVHTGSPLGYLRRRDRGRT